ncbi:hypothetical protein [Nocardiopsis xinjiangensis]|uniref:hypothetical protein n=1 Tax=Nocardiopsis xinjiangensis TaxID=124285 RepID=UPI00187298C7|nr:hypothetical protein [Nocardiopsis xinjiangensis]
MIAFDTLDEAVEIATASDHGLSLSGTGTRFGGTTANPEAFTGTQRVAMQADVATYPF